MRRGVLLFRVRPKYLFRSDFQYPHFLCICLIAVPEAPRAVHIHAKDEERSVVVSWLSPQRESDFIVRRRAEKITHYTVYIRYSRLRL